MPHPSDDYLPYAGECIGMANAMRSDDLRREWLRLAQQWIALMPHHPRADIADIARTAKRDFGLRPFSLKRFK